MAVNTNMRFSPNFLETLLIKPLKYFFSTYSGSDLKYDDDANISKLEIGSTNDFHKIPIQFKPRIIIDRGPFLISIQGLTDGMAERDNIVNTKGLDNRKNMVMYNGTMSITIDANQQGTCELLTDMVSHFLVWTKPFLCDSQGFKSFANPLNVSRCTVVRDDKEFFQVTILIPWSMEELWRVNQDAIKINEFFLTTSS
jgi:hypothetical protein